MKLGQGVQTSISVKKSNYFEEGLSRLPGEAQLREEPLPSSITQVQGRVFLVPCKK